MLKEFSILAMVWCPTFSDCNYWTIFVTDFRVTLTTRVTLLVILKSLTLPVLLFFFSLNLLTASGDERQQFNTLEKRSFEFSEEMRSLIVDIHSEAISKRPFLCISNNDHTIDTTVMRR